MHSRPAHRARRPHLWVLAVAALAVLLWSVGPTLSARALRPDRGGDPPSRPDRPPPTIPPTTVPPTTTSVPPTTTTVPPVTVPPSPSGTGRPPGGTAPTPVPSSGPPATPTSIPPGGTAVGASPSRASTPAAVPSAPAGSPAATPTTPPGPGTGAAGNCQPDPAAAIAALPPGGVFVGTGCYETSGILITKPVVIDGGVYRDQVDDKTGKGTVHPIIRVADASDVTIENVELIGADATGSFHSSLVGQAGLDVLSGRNVSIRNVSVKNTYGDGLTAFANFGRDNAPTRNLRVDGLRITNAGRQAITVGDVSDSSFNNVTIDSAAEDGWDFESDLPGIGSGNVVVSNSRSTKGVRFIEALQGPITFDNCQCQRHVDLLDAAASSHQVVTFNGGSILLPDAEHADGEAGITVRGPGRLVLNGVALGRLPSSVPPRGLAWSVTDGGFLTLDDTSVTPPGGINDRSSTVLRSS